MLEISVGDDVEFSPRRTRAAAAALGMQPVVSPGGDWPLASEISFEDVSEHRQGLDWQRKNIEFAAELGALAYCGASYGHTGVVQCRRPPRGERARVIEALGELAEGAAFHEISAL